MVMHYNRCKKSPELPAEVLPAASNPAQRNVSEICFHRKKISRKYEERAKKVSVCPELLQWAAAVGCCL